MANEQVRIDLTANDKASRTIDDVADDVEKLEKADPEVTITADDNASPAIADVRDEAEQLDKLDPEVRITADDNASAAIADVRDDAERLTRADHELILRAKIDAAKGELKALQAELDQTADKADDTNRHLDRVTGDKGGSNLRGNAIADLTGPLGEASGAASDFAGVFDGLGDISEDIAKRVGVSAEAMTGAIGGIGVAVAAAAALWTFYKGKQEEARRKTEELIKKQRDFNEALREGDTAKAVSAFREMYDPIIDKARQAGLSVEEVTRFLTGQRDAIPSLTAALEQAQTAYDNTSGTNIAAKDAARNHLNALKDLSDELGTTKSTTDKANDSMAEQADVSRDVERGLGRAEGATKNFATAQERADEATRQLSEQLDRLRGALDIKQAMINFANDFAAAANDTEQTMLEQQADVLALQQTVVDVGEALKKSPLEIKTQLDRIEAGDLYGAKAEIDEWFRMHPIVIASKLDRPGQIFVPPSGGSSPTAARAVDVPTIGVLNMTLPAGWRGDPIRAAHAQRRRTGRHYNRA